MQIKRGIEIKKLIKKSKDSNLMMLYKVTFTKKT
jgi:hypothetical protein